MYSHRTCFSDIQLLSSDHAHMMYIWPISGAKLSPVERTVFTALFSLSSPQPFLSSRRRLASQMIMWSLTTTHQRHKYRCIEAVLFHSFKVSKHDWEETWRQRSFSFICSQFRHSSCTVRHSFIYLFIFRSTKKKKNEFIEFPAQTRDLTQIQTKTCQSKNQVA